MALRDAAKPVSFEFSADAGDPCDDFKGVVERALGGCEKSLKLLRSLGSREVSA